jgi:hypothetical protein
MSVAPEDVVASGPFDFVIVGASRRAMDFHSLTGSLRRRRMRLRPLIYSPQLSCHQTCGLTVAARLTENPTVSVLVLEAGAANLDDPNICAHVVLVWRNFHPMNAHTRSDSRAIWCPL